MSVPLIVLGAGGHARECAWLATEARDDIPFTVVSFAVTDSPSSQHSAGIPVRSLEEAAHLHPGAKYIAGVGGAALRRALSARAEELGLSPATLVHRSALLAPDAVLGAGVVLFPSTVVSVSSRLGRHVHLNFGSTVSHDVDIDDHSTLSPGARIAGNVEIGRDVLIGIGANVRNGCPGARLRIADGAIVGAGACVIRDVAPGMTVIGVPARPITLRDGGARG